MICAFLDPFNRKNTARTPQTRFSMRSAADVLQVWLVPGLLCFIAQTPEQEVAAIGWQG
jgi:hypothetical protein